jgi:hypothetical protein
LKGHTKAVHVHAFRADGNVLACGGTRRRRATALVAVMAIGFLAVDAGDAGKEIETIYQEARCSRTGTPPSVPNLGVANNEGMALVRADTRVTVLTVRSVVSARTKATWLE